MRKKRAYRFFFIFILIYTLIFAGYLDIGKAKDYRPVLSGDLEFGDRLYTDVLEEDEEEEILDQYYYKRYWLKYKQKLTPDDYYYLKLQYYRKEYEEKCNYDNITLNLWGNYTYSLNEKLKNRWKINIKDKDYNQNSDKSYQSLRLKYQIDYDFDSRNDYTIYLQRQWNKYIIRDVNDNVRDKISFNWDYDVNKRLNIDTTLQMEQQLYDYPSETSNKYGKKISVGFKYKL